MIELVKLVMANPLQGVVVVLCVLALTMHLALGEIKVAMAVHDEQQLKNDRVNILVIDMNNTLIRIDENLKSVKEKQDQYLTIRQIGEVN